MPADAHGWPRLPIYTEEEARDYAAASAERWSVAVALPHPLTRAQWEAVDPPDMLNVPSEYWHVLQDVFTARCGLRPDEASILHWCWHKAWFCPPLTWIERLETALRAYDDILTEIADPRTEEEEP